MVKVKKRDERIEDFMESKITTACQKAGATAEEAAQVVKDVSMNIVNMAIVPAEQLSEIVVTSLRKVNNAAADAFVKFRDEKLKTKKSE